MSLRDSLFRLLHRGTPNVDEHETVEIGLVPLPSGPMLVSQLRDRGFDATGLDSVNLATKARTDYRILVPRREAVEATAALDELR